MFLFHKGICYLLLDGKLWIDWSSWIDYETWIKADRNPQAKGLYWKQGYCPINHGPFKFNKTAKGY